MRKSTDQEIESQETNPSSRKPKVQSPKEMPPQPPNMHSAKAYGERKTHEDVANSADLLKKFETRDLTDEETEDLLKEALALNKKLKQHLHMQTMSKQSHAASVSNPHGLGIRTKTMYAALPPIQNSGKGRSAEGTKSQGSGQSRGSHECTQSHTSTQVKVLVSYLTILILALSPWAPVLQDRQVIVFMDKTMVVSYINKQEGTQSH